jgi:hypothetical protein
VGTHEIYPRGASAAPQLLADDFLILSHNDLGSLHAAFAPETAG